MITTQNLEAPGKRNINWGNGTFLAIAHATAIAALFFWSWPAIVTAAILYWVAGSLGIGMGWHRLITHRGYKVPKLVALLTFGEGWHNNHHAHPTSARHGFKWYEIDLNWWGIRFLQLIGLARGIKRVRFDAATTVWQLVSRERTARRSYEQA